MSNKTSVFNEDGSLKIVDVSKWKRFFNYVIDTVIIIILLRIIGFLGVVIASKLSAEFQEAYIKIISGHPYLVILLSYSIYYIGCEVITGRTLGKYITGTKVVNELGEKASFKQILGRTICRFIPFEAFSFLGEAGRGFHDSIPETYVTKCR